MVAGHGRKFFAFSIGLPAGQFACWSSGLKIRSKIFASFIPRHESFVKLFLNERSMVKTGGEA
jgi:hypothetical protein